MPCLTGIGTIFATSPRTTSPPSRVDIHLHPTGFGVRADFMIAQKQLMESNYRGAIEVPTIRL